MSSSNVTWAPGADRAHAAAGWPPPGHAGPSPATLLRWVTGALAVLAGALTAGGTFPALLVIQSRRFERSSAATTTLSGWGWSSDARSDGAGRELLVGIPLTLVAAALLVAGALVLLSASRPDRRAGALTVLVGAVAAAVAAFWIVNSYVSGSLELYRTADVDGWSLARGAGYWLVLTGTVLALFALAALLVAALVDSPRRQRRAAAFPPSDQYLHSSYGPAPAAWPAGPSYEAPAASTWGETR
jgi:hypothetical protein